METPALADAETEFQVYADLTTFAEGLASRLRKKGFRGAVRAAGMTAMSLDEASPGWSDRLRRPRARGL